MKLRTCLRYVLPILVWLPVLPALGHSANESAPRNDAWWQDRHKLLNQRAAEAGEKAQVIFIGDSITQGWEGEGKEVWARYYAARNAVNLGIGGDRTQHVLWRLENGNLEGLKPKAAVVMIGTNNSNGEDNSVDQIADGIAAIVQKLRSTLPDTKVLLVAVFPRSENPTPQRGKVLMVNQVIRRLADDQNVFWTDFGHRFVDEHGLIPRELMPDYLHLSPKGYAIWADAIEDRLASLIGDTRLESVPGAAAGQGDPTGAWIWTMRDQNGNPIEAPLLLKKEGAKVTGRFARGPDRWLDIEEGTIAGNAFSFIVKRDRPDGSIMTYRMTGQLIGDTIVGKATTEMDGSQITVSWGARRN